MTNLTLCVALVALAADAPAQTNPAVSFKGDRLGMSFSEFRSMHHDPGFWSYESGMRKTWNPDYRCTNNGKAMASCYRQSTIAAARANVNTYFVDEKLVAISVSFSDGDLDQVIAALAGKYGQPQVMPAMRMNIGVLSRWDEASASIFLQPHICVKGYQATSTTNFLLDLQGIMQGDYCGDDAVLSYGQSRVVYIDRDLMPLLEQRDEEFKKAERAKAAGDL